jgi:hypothetical protein
VILLFVKGQTQYDHFFFLSDDGRKSSFLNNMKSPDDEDVPKKKTILKLWVYGKDKFNQDMNVLIYTVWVDKK